MTATKPPVALAISSFVMRGSVGLRATQFALERRGVTVWAVPTVVMPWHPGLGRSTRAVPDGFAAQLAELAKVAGGVDAVVTGYFAGADQVDAAARLIETVRAQRPDALVVVDPVTGDERGRYVPDAVAEAILTRLLPLAHIATPNANELTDLTGIAELEAAAERLPPACVIATSAVNGPGRTGAMMLDNGAWTRAEHLAVDAAPRGTGDLFVGVLLAALLAGADRREALRQAAAATAEVVRRSTSEDLALVGAQAAIAAPPAHLVALR